MVERYIIEDHTYVLLDDAKERYAEGTPTIADVCALYENGERDFSGKQIIAENHPSTFRQSFIWKDLSGARFDGADLAGIKFWNCTLSMCSFRGAEINAAIFFGCTLVGTDFSHIKLNGQKIELFDAYTLTVATPSVWNHNKSRDEDGLIEAVGHCSRAEDYHYDILQHIQAGHEITKDSRRGILFYWDGHPVGHMKLKQAKNFVATRTVKDSEGNILLWKGMTYRFDTTLFRVLRDTFAPAPTPGIWQRVDMEDLVNMYGPGNRILSPVRFIRQDDRLVSLYILFDEFIKDLESEDDTEQRHLEKRALKKSDA